VASLSAQFTVDEGNDTKLQLMALGRGLISRGEICEEDGRELEDVEAQREQEEDRLFDAAKRLAKKHPELPLQYIIQRLDNGDITTGFTEQDRSQVVDDSGNPIGPNGLPIPGNKPNGKENDNEPPKKEPAKTLRGHDFLFQGRNTDFDALIPNRT
jgi:hypothetical protein